jgi:serine protease Do
MSQRVLIRHSTGSKASTVEEASVRAGQELTFGREIGCDIQYDQDRDEYVSRRHMKLVVGDPDRLEFTVVELNARNGTFVNRSRIREPIRLKPGDVVQLGAGGPEFVFDVVREDLRETPVAGVPTMVAAAPPPFQAPVPEPVPPAQVAPEPSPGPAPELPPLPADRRSATRRSPPARRASGKKRTAGILALVILGVAALLYGVSRAEAPAMDKLKAAARKLWPQRATPRGESATPPALTVENTWRLVEPDSGRPLYQIYIANRRGDAASDPMVPGAGEELPVFVLLAGNRLEPLLTLASRSSYRPIGGTNQANAFAVNEGNTVLTSSVAAAPGEDAYTWPEKDTAGAVVVFDANGALTKTAVIARRQFPHWIPQEAAFVLGDAFNVDTASVNARVRAQAVSDSLLVRGPGYEARATTDTVSAREGVASLKVTGGPLPTVPVADQELRAGDSVQVVTASGLRPARISQVADGRYGISGSGELAMTPGSMVLDSRGRVAAMVVAGAEAGIAVATPIRQALDPLRH